MKYIVLVISMLVMVGCAQKPIIWNKDGATEEQFRRDHMSCRQYGMQSAQSHGLSGNMFVEKWISDETASCLQNLGYYQQM